MTALDLIVFAQQQGGGQAAAGAGFAIVMMLCYFGFIFLVLAVVLGSWWKIFTKAGEPGWAAIVPIYNYMIMSKICGRGEMFGLLLLVPCVNIVVGIMLTIDLAKSFGKDMGFAIGLLLLGIVFLPILAFGNSEYIGPAAGGGGGGSRRRRRDDDDDDDRPRRRRPDDDDDDDRPRRKPRRDDY
jgi:hypothetical protein